jgi:hypothetical protein
LEISTRLNLTPKWSKNPHMYGLVKVHKLNYPVRPIVSFINSPCQSLARFPLPILNPLVGKSPTFIQNSQQFIERIKMNEGKIVGSFEFDVVSLFTTTPVDKSLTIVKVKLQEDITLKDRTNLSVESILEMITMLRILIFSMVKSFVLQTRKRNSNGITLIPGVM